MASITIAHVIPITKGIGKERLSYFTSQPIAPGMLAMVPLRNRVIPAIIIQCETASDIKSSLRSSDIGMKKIISVREGYFFLPAFLRALEKISDYHASTTGTVLESLSINAILSAAASIKESAGIIREHNGDADEAVAHEGLVFQAPDKERVASYKSTIRETFAKNESVFFCVPEIRDTERMATLLEKGISGYTFVFHSKLSSKEIVRRWNLALATNHPVLIIATPSFISIPRKDIGTIIMDKEGSSSYKQERRPFLDFRTALQFYAKELRAIFLYGDTLLRPETISKYKTGAYASFLPLQFRLLSTAEQLLSDMTRPPAIAGGRKEFELLSAEAKALIANTKNTNDKIFVFAARRGTYTLTSCNDCGRAVLCHSCKTPLVIHTKNKQQIFLCHKCGYMEPARDQCASCFGWRLAPLGIGAERVADEISKIAHERPIIAVTKDTATTKETEARVRKFLDTPGAILVGTERAIAALPAAIEHVVVISLDSMFAIPDFRINERVFRLLLALREHASETFIIQTRRAEDQLFQYALKGDLMSFYKHELAERKKFGYPPAGILIKISATGTEARARQEMETVRNFLDEYQMIVFPAFMPRARGAFTMHGILKIAPEHWPDSALLHKLRRLPPALSIDISPKHLL
ncbi:MAG: hypothetical protein COW88_01665 [Candidatus Lloydbacteria bacterium CG22_combo_CG10-13_8_21_14_all_47_15]|uniref:Primosomal protein N n=1 Tax=Candidatus Lloydbacteria bacterium CG22_combo_CG10-13_8_21_14_all_47_15 TaxID=1974635 RepID=A0A2H0CVS2_9BACT|nr:MAG: hypothetical protein COW88_01665 [Candidatus Lloydbacteria bacterium CG22_combo_CG10-13_8_21_14_all_47_15]